MPLPSPFRALLPVTVLFAAASCDRPLVAPAAAPGEVEFTTGATLPAVRGFTLTTDLEREHPPVTLDWYDVAGEVGYLVQWRPGEAGAWRTLATTRVNFNSFTTDSVRIGERNYYRVAAMPSAFQAGPFTTLLMPPSVRATGLQDVADSITRVRIRFKNFGPPGTTYFVQYGTDPGLAGAVQTPGATPPGYWAQHTFEIPVEFGTRYYYRAVGTGDNGTGYDSIRTFVAGEVGVPTGVWAGFTEYMSSKENYIRIAYSIQGGWDHSGLGIQVYRIERREAGQSAWVQFDSAAPTSYRAFGDQSFPVSRGVRYEYRVLACDSAGACAASAPVRVATTAMLAPADLRAAFSSDGTVVIRWSDLSTESGYVLQHRADSLSAWETIMSSYDDFHSYLTGYVTNRSAPDVLNEYRLAGYTGNGRLGPWAYTSLQGGSGVVAQTGSATPVAATTATLRGNVTSPDSQATAWFEWGTDPALATFSSTPAAPVAGNVQVTSNITVPLGKYYYRVAVARRAQTVRGDIASVELRAPAAPWVTPSFSTAGYVAYLSWTHSGVGYPTHFRLYRGSRLMREVSAATRTFTDVHIMVNAPRRYGYRVDACTGTVCTPSLIRVLNIAAMPAPAAVTATRLADGRVQVQWQDLPGDQQYLVQWRTSTTSWQNLVSTGNNRTAYTTARVTAGTTNVYRVAALVPVNRAGLFREVSLVVP